MALGYLAIMVGIVAVISVLGVVLLFCIKEQRVKNWICYFMAVWGIALAVINVRSLPTNDIAGKIMAGVFAAFCLAGIILGIPGDPKRRRTAAYLLVSAGVLCEVLLMFWL